MDLILQLLAEAGIDIAAAFASGTPGTAPASPNLGSDGLLCRRCSAVAPHGSLQCQACGTTIGSQNLPDLG